MAQLGLIGGTMGLFTGFSILSGIEIVYFASKFLFRRKSVCCKNKEESDVWCDIISKYFLFKPCYTLDQVSIETLYQISINSFTQEPKLVPTKIVQSRKSFRRMFLVTSEKVWNNHQQLRHALSVCTKQKQHSLSILVGGVHFWKLLLPNGRVQKVVDLQPIYFASLVDKHLLYHIFLFVLRDQQRKRKKINFLNYW